MPRLRAPLILAAGVLLGSLLADSAGAQQLPQPRRVSRRPPPRAEVFRQQVNNGATTTVRYYGAGLSPDETSTVRRLEQVENELAYARDLQDLKRQYINDELVLEAQRREAQQQMYAYASYGGPFNGALAANNFPFFDGRFFDLGLFGFRRGLGFPFPGRGVGLGRGLAAATLIDDVFDDGAIKSSVARIMAQQATPEYVASLERDYDRVVARASASPSLRVALGAPTPAETQRQRRAIRAVAFDGAVLLTLKNGDTVAGEKMTQSKDREWYIVTQERGETRIRASEVVRIDIKEKSAVRFAAD